MQLDPQLSGILASIRRQIRQYIVVDTTLAVAALVLVAFWLGLLVDYLPVRLGGTEMPRSARAVLLVGVGAAIVFLIVKLLVGRLRKPLRDDSLALLVERQHPELAGRLVTSVQLTQSNRKGDSHEPALLRKVHEEAASGVQSIQPGRIFRWKPLWQKVSLVAPLAIAAIVFAAVSPSSFVHAAGRLLLLSDEPWPRQASLSMVGIELPAVTANENDIQPPSLVTFRDKVIRLPQGSSGTLRISAKADGAIVPDGCTVHYVSDDGARGQANMRRVGRVVDGEQSFVLDGPPLAGISESTWISVRGLDSRLDDYRIEAVAPPAITQMQVVTTDPDYLMPLDANASTTRTTDYQSGMRVREGSMVRLVGKSTTTLGNVAVRLLRGNEELTGELAKIDDDELGFSVSIPSMREPATIVVVPEDKTGITAQLPYRYFLGVVIDDSPEVEMRLRGIGTAVTPMAKIPILGKATDDYGIDEAKLDVNSITTPTTDDATVEPAERGVAKLETPEPGSFASTPVELDRDGNFSLTLDLRSIGEAGTLRIPDPEAKGMATAISLLAEVSDRYDLEGEHRTKSELFRLEVVTPERLLMLLERRELAMRARLEQTIDETRELRDSLDSLRREAAGGNSGAANGESSEKSEPENPIATDESRQEQILRLRAQQNGLQASKTGDELSGIAESLDDLLVEMQNNRVDSVDRSERIGNGVRDPLRAIVKGDLSKLRLEIAEIEGLAATPVAVAEKAAQSVKTAEDVLIQLTAVLEKMLDLESYNEILDMVRELIDSQDGLIEETKKERTQRTKGLFED